MVEPKVGDPQIGKLGQPGGEGAAEAVEVNHEALQGWAPALRSRFKEEGTTGFLFNHWATIRKHMNKSH